MVLTARKDTGRLLQGAQERWDARGRSIYGDAWDDPQDGNVPLRFAASARMCREHLGGRFDTMFRSTYRESEKEKESKTMAGIETACSSSIYSRNVML